MKRVLSLLFCIVLSINIIVHAEPSNFSTEPLSQYSDEDLGLLETLGIIVDGEWYDADAEITRAQFATVAALILFKSGNENYIATKEIFEDVPKYHQDAGVVELLSEVGIISGTTATTFEPDDSITIIQALKVLVNVLNYKVKAESKGGYPVGYLSVGRQIGLLDGIELDDYNAKVTGGIFTRLLINALDAKVMVYVGRDRYIESDQTLLEANYGLKKYKGIVTRTSVSGLRSDTDMSEYKIEIDGVTYAIENSSTYNHMLGYSVVYYYNSTNENIAYICKNDQANTERKIVSEEIITAEISGKDLKITYQPENGNVKNITVPYSADVIYNGKAYPDYTVSTFQIDSGSLVLLDNNGDGDCDVVFINEYLDYVVNEVNLTDDIVYAKNEYDPQHDINRNGVNYGQHSNLLYIQTKDGSNKTDLVDTDGYKSNILFLQEWNVLTVYKSKDGSCVKAIVSENKISGSIDIVYKDKVEIDGISYKLSNGYQRNINGEIGKSAFPVLKPGDVGVFCINAFGEIAAVQDDSITDKQFGYLTGVGTSNGFEGRLKLRIFTAQGNFEVYEAADKIEINGTVYPEDKQCEAACLNEFLTAETNDSENEVKQIIKYSLNGRGQVKYVATPHRPDYVGSSNDLIKLMDYRPGYIDANYEDPAYKGIYISSDAQVFGSNYIASPNLVFFEITKDEKDYKVVKSSSYRGRTPVTLYGDPEKYLVDVAMVQRTSEGIFSDESSHVLIDKVTECIDDSGEATGKLYGLYEGKATSWFMDRDFYAEYKDDIKRGDIVTVSLDSEGVVTGMRSCFVPSADPVDKYDASNTKYVSLKDDGRQYGKLYQALHMLYGYVYRKNGDYVAIKSDNIAQGLQNLYWINAKKVNIYVYDTKTDKVWLGSMEDMISYDSAGDNVASAYIHSVNGTFTEVILIK